MKLVSLLAAGMLAVFAASCSSTKSSPQTMPSEAEMMAKWQEFATPAAGHKALEPYAGRWSMKVRMFQPGQPMNESDATSEAKWVMEQRYLTDETSGNFMGMPFKGMGLSGYDNLKKKYVSTWVDNMGTGIMLSEGTYDAAKKTFTYRSEMPDLMAGKYNQSRMTDTWTDNDHHTMRMYGPGLDGKEMMHMEIAYTRAR
jgi:hypothetical protein